MAQLALPGKVRLFVLDAKTLGAVRGVPVRVGVKSASGDTVVGTFASDHAGYISFPLPREIRKRKEPGKLWVEPYLDPSLRKDITDANGVSDAAVPVTVRADERLVPTGSSPTLPSTVEADATDWKLSPTSYGAQGVTIIGQGGCEEILPSRVAERLFKFHQILRHPQVDDDRMIHVEDVGREFIDQRALDYRRGALVEYEMVWQPIGHGLGEVLYSLTLAPCEKVNVAVIDWSRTTTESRSEGTTVDERLVHDQRRDRVIEESVEASLQEWQTGESFMGGTAGTGGYGGGGMGQMWGVTGSHSIGYGTASTSGRRDAEASTVQDIADRVAQATTLSRGLRSTVIVQASQAEREVLETRVVANHNHSHALTVLYYQVVRHHCVTTRPARERDLLFIKAPDYTFDRATILRHRGILQRHLLDASLASAFDVLQRSPAIEAAVAEQERVRELLTSAVVSRLAVRVGVAQLTGQYSSALSKERLLFVLSTTSGRFLSWSFHDHATYDHHFSGSRRVIDQPFANPADPATDPPTVTTAVFDVADAGLNLDDIYEIGLTFDVQGDDRHKLKVDSLQVRAVLGDAVQEVLATTTDHFFTADSEWWHTPNRLPRLTDGLEEQIALGQALIDHIAANAAHYRAVLWMNENPLERARRLSEYVLDWPASDGTSRRGLASDFVDNVPLGVFGDYVIFRVGDNRPIQPDEAPIDERILSVPTRGAFAEAKLSHCNASEVIDDTRFWDWQISPCPDEAPGIAALNAGSRAGALTAAPTPLPASGIGIADLPGAPEPMGLREVMELMRTPDIFRDLSTVTELGPLLQKLVEVAGEVEKARIAKLDAAYSANNQGRQGAGGGVAGPGGMTGGSLGGGDPQTQARQISNVRSAIERAVQSGQISPEQGRTLTQEFLRRLTGDSGQSLIDNPTVQSLLGSGDASRVALSRGDERVEIEGAGTDAPDGGTGTRTYAPIRYGVELVPQPDKLSCWAAAMAMLVGYRRRASLDAETLAQEAGRTLRQSYGWDRLEEVRAYFGFRDVPVVGNMYPSPETWYEWLRALGPLWVTVQGAPIHAIVVHGIEGDMTPAGTRVHIHNPQDPSVPLGSDPIDFAAANGGASYTRTVAELNEQFGIGELAALAPYSNWRILYLPGTGLGVSAPIPGQMGGGGLLPPDNILWDPDAILRDPYPIWWGGFNARLAERCRDEWERWHVPATGHPHTHNDPGMAAVVGEYWINGVGGGARDVDIAWSAAFISWAMRQTGAGMEFSYSSAHINYIRAARQNRDANRIRNPFWLFCLDEVAVRVGDLVCRNRLDKPVAEGGVYSTFTCTNLSQGPGGSPHGAAHCDIVTEIVDDGGVLYALGIGGNKMTDGHYDDGGAWVATNITVPPGAATTGTVGRERYRLDAAGQIDPAHNPHVFAILRTRETLNDSIPSP